MKMCLRIFVLVFKCTNWKSARKMCIMLFYLLFWSAPENGFTLIHVFIIYTYWTVLEIYWENMSFLWVLLPPHNFAMFCSRKFTPFFSGFCRNQQIFFQEWSLNYTIRTKISLNITHVLFFFDKDKNKQVETYCLN